MEHNYNIKKKKKTTQEVARAVMHKKYEYTTNMYVI